MLKFFMFLQNFLAEPLRRDDRGATAVEYGLIVALIAAAIIVAPSQTLARTLMDVFNNITAGSNPVACHTRPAVLQRGCAGLVRSVGRRRFPAGLGRALIPVGPFSLRRLLRRRPWR